MRWLVLAVLVGVVVVGWTTTPPRVTSHKRRVMARNRFDPRPEDYSGPGYSFSGEDVED